jgi:hypothetical protein
MMATQVLLFVLAVSLGPGNSRAVPPDDPGRPDFLTIPVTVRSEVQLDHPSDPYTELPNSSEWVWADTSAAYTDSAGFVAVPVSQPGDQAVVTELRGLYCDVNRMDGPDGTIMAVGSPGEPLFLEWNDSNSHIAERDCYYSVNRIHRWAKRLDPAFTCMDFPMTCNVNTQETCSANWTEGSIRFSAAGGGCVNMAQMSDAVMHVYAHGITRCLYLPGQPPNSSGMAEGLSDCAAMTLTNDPYIGRGIFGGDSYLRDGMNTRGYPGTECDGDPFCLGEILMGAMWKTRANLIRSHGYPAVAAIYDPLLWRTWGSRQYTITGFLTELLLQDDDDGDLSDGTPHWSEICDAFAAHDVLCPEITVGACCRPDGFCEVTEASLCEGLWRGPGTDCEPDWCPASAVEEPDRTGGFELGPASPNPFSASTRLRFVMEQAGHARLGLYDSAGRLVRQLLDGPVGAGPHELVWDGRSDRARALPSGLYFCRLQALGMHRQAGVILAR